MITAYLSQDKYKAINITASNQALMHDAVWIDLLRPSKSEEQMVEKSLQLDLPTREEMQEIEPSSRLYKEFDTVFLTATMIAKSDSKEPKSDAITIIIKDDKLITVRYIEPLAFDLFVSHLPKLTVNDHYAIYLVIELLDSSISRLADILEHVGRCLDDYSQAIFNTQSNDSNKINYKKLLQQLGSSGDLNAKAWESLVSFNRLNGFFGQAMGLKFNDDVHAKLATLTNDINSLSDHVKFLTSKINFLLDATLGMVNIEQNNIIKIFSIAAVIFLPPTLIASIYGMNFTVIPELNFRFGYPMAIGLMLLSGWLPYMFFKIKKWL